MHLKALTAPKAWNWNLRKAQKFVIKPSPGSHPLENSIPLGLVLKQLVLAKNKREIKKVLNSSQILINGKRTRSFKAPLGFMDSLSLPEVEKHYRVLFDSKGRLVLKETTPLNAKLKISKIVGKKLHKKGMFQLSLSDGRNLLTKEKNFKTGEGLVLRLPEQSLEKVLPFEKGAEGWLVSGSHKGFRGTIEEMGEKNVLLRDGTKIVRALKEHVFITSKEYE